MNIYTTVILDILFTVKISESSEKKMSQSLNLEHPYKTYYDRNREKRDNKKQRTLKNVGFI